MDIIPRSGMTRRRSDFVRFVKSPWGRALVSLGLLGAVLTQVDVAGALERLEDADLRLVAAAVGLNAIALIVGSLRWHVYLEAASLPVGRRRAAEAFFAGAFSSIVLPTAFAGDAVRGWLVAPEGHRSRAFATIVVDRGTVLGCGLLVGWTAVLVTMSGDSIPGKDVLALTIATGVYVSAVIAMGGSAALARRLRRHVPAAVARMGAAALPALRSGFSGKRVVALGLALGTGYQLLVFLSTWVVARSLSIPISFALVAVVAPAVLMLSAIPISIGGLGVREASWAALLAPAGVDVTDAALLSLVSTVAFLVPTIPGGVVLLAGRRTVDAVPPPRPGDGDP
jgi:glycosyltransferase 2 family protein